MICPLTYIYMFLLRLIEFVSSLLGEEIYMYHPGESTIWCTSIVLILLIIPKIESAKMVVMIQMLGKFIKNTTSISIKTFSTLYNKISFIIPIICHLLYLGLSFRMLQNKWITFPFIFMFSIIK